MTGEHDAGQPDAFTADQIRHVVDMAVNPFVIIDRQGTALWASSTVEELLGISATDLLGRSMLDFVAPSSVEAAVGALASAAERADQQEAAVPATWEGVGPVVEMRRPDGKTVSCAIAVATPVRTGLPCFVLQLRRADAAHSLEKALRAMGTGRPLTEILGEVAAVLRGELPQVDVVILHDHRGEGRLEPPAGASAIWGDLDLPTAAGDAWADAVAKPSVLVERAVEDLPAPLRDVAEARGYRRLTLLAVTPVIDGDDTTSAVVSVWSRAAFPMHALNHDRMERCGSLMTMALQWEYGRRALEWAATHDGLTGLQNRSAFLTHLQAVGGRRSAGAVVLYLDLDDFKPVNDRHGHALGDRVLVEVTARLRRCVRPADIVARLGGDEFAVLCPGLGDLEDAELLAERLVAEVGTPIQVEGVEVQIGLSVGIADFREGDDVEHVLNRADDALRAAKGDGKSRWRLG
jgi:diguanylate cyclase (GGDEF)-like protein/PAS domain S-box-containing protein